MEEHLCSIVALGHYTGNRTDLNLGPWRGLELSKRYVRKDAVMRTRYCELLGKDKMRLGGGGLGRQVWERAFQARVIENYLPLWQALQIR